MWAGDHPGGHTRWFAKRFIAAQDPPTYAGSISTKHDGFKWGDDLKHRGSGVQHAPSWSKGVLSTWKRVKQRCTRLVACRAKPQLRVKTPSLSPQEKINKLLVPYHEPHPLILRPSPSQKPLHDGKPHSIFDVTPLFTYLRATHTIPDCALHEPRDLPRRSFEGYAAEFICTRPKRLNDVVGSIMRQLTEGAPHAEARDIEYLRDNFPSMQFTLPFPLPHLCSNRHPSLPILWFAAHLASRSATASALLLQNGVERAVAELYWDPGLSHYHCGQVHHACYMLLRSLSVHCNLQDCVEKVLLRQEVIDTSRRQSLFLVEYDEGWTALRYELMHVM